ncbi:MAG: alpha-hydroxy-acid oxidizing protein [Acidobacteriia bacterium]|nr:alpha-hydroxy-acid oxidizing protein [Terriglobia bacterium]
MLTRRHAIRSLSVLAAGSPLWAQAEDDVMGPINLHEFEEAAKRKLNKLAYDFIAGGVEDELTLRANREAFNHFVLLPRVMIDVSSVDTSVQLFSRKLDFPIFIAPTGGKNLVLPNADETVAQAALNSKTVICTATGTQKILEEGKPLLWWSNSTGQPNKAAAASYARRVEDQGGKAIVLTVDNAYQSNRDRNNRNRFDYGYMQTGVPKPGDPPQPPRNPARPAMWQPHTANLTWDYIDWVRSASSIPIILKGILNPIDAGLAVQRGASAISCSNHGGRQLDGAIGSLDALPDVVDAVGGKIPVLMDGGIRRGSDILKALALGAKGVLVGRSPLWGLAAYGQPGVERVLWMLGAELKLAMALAGIRNTAEIDRKIVKKLG